MAYRYGKNLKYDVFNPDQLKGIYQHPIISNTRSPSSSDLADIGTIWVDKSVNEAFIITSITANVASWVELAGVPKTATDGQLWIGSTGVDPVWANLASSGGSVTITNTAGGINLEAAGVAALTQLDGDGGSAVPLAGVITLAGGTNITTAAAVNTVTFNLDASPSVAGSLTAATTITATAGDITASAGDIVATLGAGDFATTVTAGTGITATTGAITASTGDVVSTLGAGNFATTVTAGTGITATTGAIAASAGAVTASTTVTGGTGIIATTGNITASAGDIVATLGDITAAAGDVVATLGAGNFATTCTGGTGLYATTGDVTANAGDVVATLGAGDFATTVTAGTGVTATTGNITASTGNFVATLGSVSAATTVTGGTGVTATTGDVAASAGAVTASTTVTGGTGVTATTGNVTATAGDVEAATATKGFICGSGLKVIDGAGSPAGAVTAPKGSLYLRTDGSGASDRAYINTDSGTTWTALTTAA